MTLLEATSCLTSFLFLRYDQKRKKEAMSDLVLFVC